MLRSLLAHVGPALRYITARVLFPVLRVLYPPLDALLKRVRESPGIPVPNSTSSYWMQAPSSISQHNAEPSIALPEHADIVIIGSGITGVSFARAILDHSAGDVKPPRVVMLEARDTCSGATGRNGGHITPVLYQDYVGLKRKHGLDMAQKIIRFRLSHIVQLLAVAKEEGLLQDSQCRLVETFDVFHDRGLFRKAQSWLREYQTDLPEESAHYKVFETREQLSALGFSEAISGCFSTQAGAVHPYRLVTGILTRLLTSYQPHFDLYTHTPCTEIRGDDQVYTVHTPRGTIRTRHVVHATNGWVSHLVPGMRGKIFPARGVMTAQDTGVTEEGGRTGMRSYNFYPNYDYLTQQLPSSAGSSYPEPDGEMMLGSGVGHAVLADIANADDSDWDPTVGQYLRRALGEYFSSAEKAEMRGMWSGILGISADEKPWVGRIPAGISGRPVGDTRQTNVPPGEWIAAGYSGEGMVHAWLSGKALAAMVLGCEMAVGLPELFSVTEERWRAADFEGFVSLYLE